ncbi:MAG: proton-conducting transporter membrane subunit [Humidesulfovibrio sp.]|uniref:proton-conducting transporter transmembrane domain-containing protein n=1 Tax=Humidesulfovibrio sp. TaxID=2910988 RepID=UPI00273714E2|nr:proton-conducting transporter membrane subunit [Humidesulfovibrio sp.]MDP2847564.1 proton-conducting transporter membrane subunit [Humidesulfovibrio sp.]
MTLFAACLLTFLLGALASLLPRSFRAANALGSGFAALGCLLGLVPAVQALASPQDWELILYWPPPWGLGALGLDGISALFLTPALGLMGLGAVYGRGYLANMEGRKRAGPPWFFYNILAASITGVFSARDPLLLLLFWEGMALSSYFLVCMEDRDGSVRRAGRIYLVASHLGAAFLLALCLQPGASWPPAYGLAPGASVTMLPGADPAGLIFLLALVGFGSKAGLAPLGVWLPEAHPAAPSHVSAVLSGVMIKTGVYGILRVLLAYQPEPWWGWTLIAMGGGTAVLGVAGALSQAEIKRLLAWSSMENAGLMLLGLGLGTLGRAHDAPLVAALGFSAALIHMVNHGVFKSLLFFCAGSVLHGAGERRMDQLGGLLKRMPATGTAFLVASLGICGLPPLGGFASELLLGLAAMKGLLLPTSSLDIPSLAALAALILCAGIAAAVFVGAFGAVFLGEPRSQAAQNAHEAPALMRWPMIFLACLAPLMGLCAPLLLNTALGVLEPALPGAQALGAPLVTGLTTASLVFALLLALFGGLFLLRRTLLRGRDVRTGPTWDCGYIAPTARIQYTYSSFAQPLSEMFRSLTGSTGSATRPWRLFPVRVGYFAETQDRVLTAFLAAFNFMDARLEALHRLQQGQVHVYVLYIAATLVALLAWGLW